jgi:hypothetical protein
VLAERGDRIQPRRTHQRALRILAGTAGDRHPYYLSCKRNLTALDRA